MAKKKDNAVSEAAAAMGRKGGPARAKNLSAKRRKEIAQAGAAARWGKGAKKATP
jgi:hypothetical protein